MVWVACFWSLISTRLPRGLSCGTCKAHAGGVQGVTRRGDREGSASGERQGGSRGQGHSGAMQVRGAYVFGGRVAARHDSDAVVFSDECVLLALQVEVIASNPKLGVDHCVAHLEGHLLLHGVTRTDSDDVARRGANLGGASEEHAALGLRLSVGHLHAHAVARGVDLGEREEAVIQQTNDWATREGCCD